VAEFDCYYTIRAGGACPVAPAHDCQTNIFFSLNNKIITNDCVLQQPCTVRILRVGGMIGYRGC